MAFIDEVSCELFAGRGGNGMASFRREKYVEFGGPWGGNGGHGGSIYFVGDEGMQTLADLRYRKHIRAEQGEHGKSKGMHGKNAEHTYIRVPLGTIVYDETKTRLIGEVLRHGEELLVAKGGKGGRGNIDLRTHRNPAPNMAEKGDPGEHLRVRVELKVLADVGLIGLPSVGKSTLISRLSNARPKIASYPFTTLSPNLGMVEVKDRSFVLADLPGLIENAHQGSGLGIRFLKHIERCRVFIHVLDATSEDPARDYRIIRKELEAYDPSLLDRPEIIVLNRIDLCENREPVTDRFLKGALPISALKMIGLDALVDRVIETLDRAPRSQPASDDHRTYTLEQESTDFLIERRDGVFHLSGDRLRLLFERTDFTKDEAIRRFARQLRAMGVDEALRKKGAKHGDTVKIFDFEFEFIDQ
ncbi:MAG: GTPase ObgE [Acholeplasmataceae bacterium]